MKNNFKTFLLLLVLIVSLAPVAAPVQARAVALEGLEAFIDEWMRAEMEANQIPNAAVSIVQNGQVVFARGYGFSNLEHEAPVSAEKTLFRIGSVSKLMTWTAVMQLVEQGKLDLDADVNTYLDFEIPARLARNPQANPPAAVTLRHLMTHTAGFEAYPDAIFRLSEGQLLPLNEYVRTHRPERVYPPGEVMAYSNYGTSLAGYVVERVSGQPFVAYVEQQILVPLGMQHSTPRQPLPPELSGSLAQAYRYVAGEYQAGQFEYMQAPEGGMSATAADMARFMLAHLPADGASASPIVGSESLRPMHIKQYSHHPEQGGMTLGFMEGHFNGQRTLFHGGSTMLYDSGLYLLPEQQTGLFVVYSGGSHLIHTTLFQAFLDRYYPAEQPKTGAAPAQMLERSRQYAGEYYQNSRSFTTDESLTALLLGVVTVAVDEAGYLLVTHVGETSRFMEIEPGVYHKLDASRTQDYFGPFQTLVFQTDPHGNSMLTSDGPMTYSKAPWYASSGFTMLGLVVPFLLLAGSIIFWLGRGLVRRVRRSGAPSARLTGAARLAAGAFAGLYLVLLVGVVMTGEPHPVYNLPPTAYGMTPALDPLLSVLPLLLSIIGAMMALLTVLSWRRGNGSLLGRLHYSLLTAACLGVVWIFYYWNLL